MPSLLANPRGPIEIAYESFGAAGAADAPAVLLIMGLGAQMTRWNVELCELLAARGYRAIRFDNRDCGRSTHCDALPLPDIGSALRGGPLPPVPYTLEDMADDSVGLLAALGIGQAHIAGASMGAAIAQIIAARHPTRTLSLTSIMSSSGNPMLPPPTPTAALSLFAPLPLVRNRANMIIDGIARYRAVASPGYPTAEAQLQSMFGAEYDRAFYPQGVVRQLAAIMASGDRRPLLRTIAAPTVVLHGADDPLIPAACGKDVADNIPGAELRIVPGMGHDFPLALTDVFADAICAAAVRPPSTCSPRS